MIFGIGTGKSSAVVLDSLKSSADELKVTGLNPGRIGRISIEAKCKARPCTVLLSVHVKEPHDVEVNRELSSTASVIDYV